MSNGNPGWPDSPANPAKPDGSLARLAHRTKAAVRDTHGRFITGNNGGGRKKGSRNRLTETFIAAIETDFADYGPEALAKLRVDDPAAFLRIVASLVPRDLILKREQFPDYSDHTIEELEDLLKRERQNEDVVRSLQRARGGY